MKNHTSKNDKGLLPKIRIRYRILDWHRIENIFEEIVNKIEEYKNERRI